MGLCMEQQTTSSHTIFSPVHFSFLCSPSKKCNFFWALVWCSTQVLLVHMPVALNRQQQPTTTHYPSLDHFSLLSSLSQPFSFSTPYTSSPLLLWADPSRWALPQRNTTRMGQGHPDSYPGNSTQTTNPAASSCPVWKIHLLHHPKVMTSLRCPLPFMVSSHAQHFQYFTRCWPFFWQGLGSSHHWQYTGITEKQVFTVSYLKTLIWKKSCY